MIATAWLSCAALASPTATASPSTLPDDFPQYASIEGNVGFWVRVFAEWNLGQAVVHDTERPELVYEVVDLPGEARESYTPEQQAYLARVVEGWTDYLAYLEAQVAAARPLSDQDKGWVLHMTGIAGGNALEGAADRLRTQRGLRERFREGLERSGRYESAIRQILEEEGVPADIAYLPHVESSFQCHAYSKAGAAGLWQFTRGTGQRYLRITSDIDERLDPLAATRAAARYLREAHDALESWPLALTSYNHGVQGMVRAKDLHGDFESVLRDYRGRAFGFASRNFYAEFLAAREVASRPEHYFPEGLDPERPLDDDRLVLPHRASPASIARAYALSAEELARLNPAWGARSRSREIVLPEGTCVWLPAGTLEAATRAGVEAPVLPEAPPAVPSPGSWYVVRSGDTLAKIASRYGITLATLREMNDLPASSGLIRPGERLRVRGGAGAHVVQRGDTLNEIAGRYRVKIAELLQANRLEANAVIHPGQKLHIP